jgi:hypothetical protein
MTKLIESDDFTIEDLGIQEEWVYDIEVEDNHNFFANNICVHNSNYLSVGAIINKEMPNASTEQKLDRIQELIKDQIQPKINETIQNIHKRLNSYNTEVLEMDQEVIADVFASIASKRYFCNVLMSDGNKLAKPKQKATGISLISKSTPDEIKKLLKPITSIVLENDNKKLLDYILETKNKFLTISPELISRELSVASLDYEWKNSVNEPTEHWKMATKANIWKEDSKKFLTSPINSKASLVANELIKEHKLESKHDFILPNEKIKMIYLKTPNAVTGKQNVVAFKNPSFLYDVPNLIKYIDYEMQWEKEFINKIKVITDTLNYSLDFENQEIDEDEW